MEPLTLFACVVGLSWESYVMENPQYDVMAQSI